MPALHPPHPLPKNLVRRVLVIAPNLTIAGSVDKNVQAEGLMKDFCDTQWNCYRTHNLLPANSPLPKVGSLKDLRPGDAESLTDKDVIVTNYQKLKPNLLESQFPHDFFDAIIVDEAHHAESQCELC